MQDSSPSRHLTWADWRLVLGRTFRAMTADHASLIAAGCAFYAMVAFFPAISMLIAIYGLMFDPYTVEPAMRPLHGLMPHSVFVLLQDWVRTVLYQERHYYGVRLAISSAITIFASMSGTKSVMQALNLAFHETERRRGIELSSVAMALTLAGMVAAALALGLIVALPEILRALGVHHDLLLLIRLLGAAVALLFVMAAIAALYRFGPSRSRTRWTAINAGTLTATLIWLAASEGFSLYNEFYGQLAGSGGPLASALLMMGWFFVSSYALLLGGELNAQIEKLQNERSGVCDPRDGMS
jgi:membrane protein